MEWEIEGVNYWENPDCPKEYLEGALIELVEFVEGVQLPVDHFENDSREHLVDRVAFYEHVSDK